MGKKIGNESTPPIGGEGPLHGVKNKVNKKTEALADATNDVGLNKITGVSKTFLNMSEAKLQGRVTKGDPQHKH